MNTRCPAKLRRKPGCQITIPDRVGPHVKLVFSEMKRQGITYDRVQDLSGVQRPALKAWRKKNRPGLESIEAVLGALGFDLVAVPRSGVLPEEIVEALRPIANRMAMTMPDTVRALTEIVSGVHARFGSVSEQSVPDAG